MIHLVGRLTDEVFSFLGPATEALAGSGLAQTVVIADDLRYRHQLRRFHDDIDLVLIPESGGRLLRWQASMQALRKLLVSHGDVKAVHLHGFLPSLIGSYVTRSLGLSVPMYYSPHGSKSLGSLHRLGSLMLWCLKPVIGSLRDLRAISSLSQEARALHTLTDTQSIEVAESPVSEAFFDVERHEVHHPLIVTGSRFHDPRAAELFAQLAVLLSDKALRLSFNWIGRTDQNSQVRLRAADVSVYDVREDSDLASRLAAGWVYLAPGRTRGFPVFLAEAMAVGLPCVAIDTPDHRDVIHHGVTGFLCRTEEEILYSIAQLIDTPGLRAAMGAAARRAARQRFSEARFRDSLLSAYDLPTGPGGLSPLSPLLPAIDGSDLTSATPAAPPLRNPTPAGAIDLSPL
ncbi:glycosyltransferase [Methylibium sp.]|uniref:glycosyltransferase n=1 Tax=Methylibium sp. TaxID=2067992 RepID=UPI003D0BDFDB